MQPLSPDKRDAVLDAALALFADRGFHGTPVPMVADKANVATGTIYRYFASKESLVNAVYLREKEELGRALLDDFPFASPPREQFHHFWVRCTKYAKDKPLSFKFLELHHHAPYLAGEARRLESAVLQPVFEFFAQTGEQKITKPLPAALLGAIVWGALVGVIRAGWEDRLDPTEDVLRGAEQCCWEAIRA